MSRADVASLVDGTDETAIYASALVYFLENTNMSDGLYIITSSEDRKICEEALSITAKHLSRLKEMIQKKKGEN